VAAAVVYSAMVIVLFWHTRRTWLRVIAVVVAVLVPCCVGYSRIYRGMHHLTDVIAGALLGAVWVLVSYLVLRSAQRRYGHSEPSSVANRASVNHRAGESHTWPAPDPDGWRPYPERDTDPIVTKTFIP
jgi:membrane-associated phospholipid phosphatase